MSDWKPGPVPEWLAAAFAKALPAAIAEHRKRTAEFDDAVLDEQFRKYMRDTLVQELGAPRWVRADPSAPWTEEERQAFGRHLLERDADEFGNCHE